MPKTQRAGTGDADPKLEGLVEGEPKPSGTIESPKQGGRRSRDKGNRLDPLADEHFGTGSKKGRGKQRSPDPFKAIHVIAEVFGKGRGMARRSLELIEAMYAAAEAAQPITGRGIGYKLFTAGLIPSVAKNEMQRVYRLLKEARERGNIPWEWIVDETRALERTATWDDPAEYARCVAQSYRRDFWNQQSLRCEVWSEKGTVRGVLQPVLDKYAVGFRVMHGFSSATAIYDVSQDDDGRELVALYVGDFDPSGLYMSEEDLPKRLTNYDGDHITLERIALTREHVNGLPSFPATDKRKDPRYKWFRANYGDRCWELDAMDPNDLRDCVEEAIMELIEPVAWERCEAINTAEQESLRTILQSWKGAS